MEGEGEGGEEAGGKMDSPSFSILQLPNMDTKKLFSSYWDITLGRFSMSSRNTLFWTASCKRASLKRRVLKGDEGH